MADGGEIAELFATLGLRVNQGQWAQGDAQIGQTQAALGRLGAGAGTASKAFGNVAPAAAHAGAAVAAAGHEAAISWGAVGTVIEGALAYLGARVSYEHLIKSNQDMQDTTISLAATIQGQLGGSFQEATGKANDLYKEWQKFSMVSGSSTTAEFVEFGKQISAATFSAKGNLQDLNQLTEQGMIAAKVLAAGRPAGYAAIEISEMLSGNVRNSQMFVKQLLGFIHMTEDEFRALDEKGRLNATLKALNSAAFKDAGKAMGSSFSGVKSTLEDIFQIATRTAGEPVFGAITSSLHKLNDWLLSHQATIDRVVGTIGNGLAIAWSLVVQVWDKAYAVFDRNRDVITKIAEKVGGELWVAFQLFVAVLDIAIDKVDSLLGFFDHGFGKFLLDAMLAPGLLTMIADLLDRIGVSMEKIKDIATFNVFGKFFELVSGGGGDDQAAAGDGAPSGQPDGKKRALPRLSVGNALQDRIDLLSAKGKTIVGDPRISDEDKSKQIDALRDQIEPLLQLRDMAQGYRSAPQLPAGAGGQPAAINVGGVTVGDINVTAPNADPAEVAAHVRRTFHEELGNTLRKTMDVYG